MRKPFNFIARYTPTRFQFAGKVVDGYRKLAVLFIGVSLLLAALVFAASPESLPADSSLQVQEPHIVTLISNCATISSPGTYELAGSFTNITGGTCFLLSSNNVTFDCRGFTISGPATVFSATGRSGIEIRNCTVRGTNYPTYARVAAAFTNTGSSAIINNSLFDAYSITLTNSTNNLIKDNYLKSGSTYGRISISNVGFPSGINNQILGNSIISGALSDDGYTGIKIQANYTLVEGNSIINRTVGIYAEGAYERIRLNLIQGAKGLWDTKNTGQAIQLRFSKNSLVEYNLAYGGAEGLFAADSYDSVIRGNNFSNNNEWNAYAGSGIYIAGWDTAGGRLPTKAGNLTIEQNIINDNYGNGIYIYFDYFSNEPGNHLIKGNMAQNNSFNGIVVSSAGNMLLENYAARNGRTGIIADSNRSTIRGNVAHFNNQDGFYISNSGTPAAAIENNTATNNLGYGMTIGGGASYIEFLHNSFSNNINGLAISGIVSNANFGGNYFLNNSQAVWSAPSPNSHNNLTFAGNTFLNNTYGLYFSSASNSTIFNNSFINNQYAADSSWDNSDITSNAFSDNARGIVYHNYNAPGRIIGNTFLRNSEGIYAGSSFPPKILGNTFQFNVKGITLPYDSFYPFEADNNTFKNNSIGITSSMSGNVSSNYFIENSMGIEVKGNPGGLLIFNNYFNNTANARGGSSNTKWNTTKKLAFSEDGLAAYWRFDDGTGNTAADSSGNGNHGTLVNGPLWTGGKYGGALGFDGIDDRVSIADSPSLRDPLKGNFSIMQWIRANSTGYEDFVLYGAADGSYYVLIRLDSGRIQFAIWDGINGQNYWSTTTYNDNEYHHVAIVRDLAGGAYKIYADGALLGTAAINTTVMNDKAVYLTLGSSSWDSFNGTIDEVKIYKRAFSAAEIGKESLLGTSGKNIIGGPWTGGNFWHDYAGVDANGDGLGDTKLPYNASNNITGGGDYAPLTNVPAPNNPPVLNPVGNRLVNVTKTLLIQLSASDPDNNALTFGTNAASLLPSAFSFSPITGLFNWTPKVNNTGNYSVVFNVTDGFAADSETVLISVILGAACGDLNNDGSRDVLDVVGIVNIAFRGGAPPDPAWIADINGDGIISDVLDAVGLINHVFRGKPEPTCGMSSASALQPSTASATLGTPTINADGTISISVKLSSPFISTASQFQIDYDSKRFSFISAAKPSSTLNFDIYSKQPAAGKLIVGLFKSDGSSEVNSGVLVSLKFSRLIPSTSAPVLGNMLLIDTAGIPRSVTVKKTTV